MLRRIQVLSWFGKNVHTEVTKQYAPLVVSATIAAAEEYINGRPPLAPRALQ